MIANYFISQKVERFLFVTGDNLEEAVGVFSNEQNQLIVIDDIWGPNISSNYKNDVKLRDFARIINDFKNSSNHYLILTSREYIIKDVLNNSNFEFDTKDILETDTFIINLNEYSKEEKARILLNHLIFYGFEKEYITYLKYEDTLENIVNHRNYSPRHIEYFIKKYLKKESQYHYSFYKELYKYLDNPKEFWNHNFRKNTSDTSQLILLIILISSDPVDLLDLEETFNSIQQNARITVNKDIRPEEFSNELKLLEDFYIISERMEYSTQILVRFQSPGIKDYLLEYLRSDGKNWIKPLIENALFFNQLNFIFDTTNREIQDYDSDISLFGQKIILNDILQNTLKVKILKEFETLNFSTLEEREFSGEFGKYNKPEETKYWKLILTNNLFDISKSQNIDVRNFIIQKVQEDIENYNSEKLKIVNWHSMPEFPRIIKIIKPYTNLDSVKIIAQYYDSITFTREFDSFYNFKEIFPETFNTFLNSNIKKIRKAIRYQVIDDIDYYRWYDMDNELDSHMDYYIEDVFKKYGLRFTSKFINEIEEMAEQSFRYSIKKTKSSKKKASKKTISRNEKIEPKPLDTIVDEYLPDEYYEEFNTASYLKNSLLDKKLVNELKLELKNEDSILTSFKENKYIFSAFIEFLVSKNIDLNDFNNYSIIDSYFDYYCISKKLNSEILKEFFFQLANDSFSYHSSITEKKIIQLLAEHKIVEISTKSLNPIIISDKHWFTFSSYEFKLYFIIEYLKKIIDDKNFKEKVIDTSCEIYELKLLQMLSNACPQRLNFIFYSELNRFIDSLDLTSKKTITISIIKFFNLEFDLEWNKKSKKFEESSSSNSETFIEMVLQFFNINFHITSLDIFFLKDYYTKDNILNYKINKKAYNELYHKVINTETKREGISILNNRNATYFDIKLFNFAIEEDNYVVLKKIGMEDYLLEIYENILSIVKRTSPNS